MKFKDCRMIIFFTLIIGFMLISGIMTNLRNIQSFEIIYIKKGDLYLVEITPFGELREHKKICCIPAHKTPNTLDRSTDGKYIAFSIYSDIQEGATLWVVEAKPGSTPYKLGWGTDPKFSPTGHLLAYTYAPPGSDRWNQSVRIINLDTGKSFILREKSHSPYWSISGEEIALIDESKKDFRAIVAVIDIKTGRVLFSHEDINPHTPLISPNGRWVAFNPSLSRPKLEGIIIDRKTLRVIPLPYPSSSVLDWSPDSRWLLWARCIVDPQNDGSCLRTEVWLTSSNGKKSRKISDGDTARFIPDGRNILYLCKSDLYIIDLKGKRRKLLLYNVDKFVVWKLTADLK